jgi:MFS family permease
MPGSTDWSSRAGRAARVTKTHLNRTLGGAERARVIVLLACVLALNSADSSTVGASATELRHSLHIGNTDIGLLVTVASLVAAVFSIPFGVVADRFRRTRALGLAIIVWGVAMLWSATATSFDRLLLSRLFLGVVTAIAGPVVASLIGDYFAAGERGRIYSYILGGELAGAGIGFIFTGDIAALSWRAAFVLLALPAFILAWYVLRLPEPERGTRNPLPVVLPDDVRPSPPRPVNEDTGDTTDAQRLAAARGLTPNQARILTHDLRSMNIFDAVRAVLGVRTNVILIVASACGYFYLSGIQTFGVEFVKDQYHTPQAVANLLLLVVGGGALLGALFAGGLSDRWLQRGYLNARIMVAALAAVLATVLFLPALTTRSAITALPYVTVAAMMLSAQNPPIDAARLDIMPPLLWGRAEGVRTALRTLAQSLAPVTFGAASDHLFGGGRGGLQWTFSLMLVVMAASGIILFRALKSYPRDVATAAASVVPAENPVESGAEAGAESAGPETGVTAPVQEAEEKGGQAGTGGYPAAPPAWPSPPSPYPPAPTQP